MNPSVEAVVLDQRANRDGGREEQQDADAAFAHRKLKGTIASANVSVHTEPRRNREARSNFWVGLLSRGHSQELFRVSVFLCVSV